LLCLDAGGRQRQGDKKAGDKEMSRDACLAAIEACRRLAAMSQQVIEG
jgi:hypothetical protein